MATLTFAAALNPAPVSYKHHPAHETRGTISYAHFCM